MEAAEERSVDETVPDSSEMAEDLTDRSETLSYASEKAEDLGSVDGDRSSVRSCVSSSSTPTKMNSEPSSPIGKAPDSTSSASSTSSQSSKSSSQRSSDQHGPPQRCPGGITKEGKVQQDLQPATRPNRPGVEWKVGCRVESKDFMGKWYPARIVDIDDGDSTVLIHFDGWNQRYDQWMSMNSDDIHPSTRHSQRKSKQHSRNAKVDHKVGDSVFAKWTDCRMYAGTIARIFPNGSYEVLFYDGFKKTVQPINVKVMPSDVQKEYSQAGLLPDPGRKMKQLIEKLGKEAEKLQTDSSVKKDGLRMKGDLSNTNKKIEGQKSKSDIRTSTKSEENEKKSMLNPPTREKLKERGSPRVILEKAKLSPTAIVRTNSSGAVLKKRKLMIGGSFQAHKAKLGDHGVGAERKLKKTLSSKVGKKDKKRLVLMKDRKGHFGPKCMKPKEPTAQVGKVSIPDRIVAVEVPHFGAMTTDSSVEGIKSTDSDEDISLADLAQKSESDKECKSQLSSPESISLMTCVISPPILLPVTGLVATKAFCVEEDHNKYKCPLRNCKKAFRKESLLDSHIKYYHKDDGSTLDTPQPSKKRRQTISVCSETDSEISIGAKSTSSRNVAPPPTKRKRESAASTTSIAENTEDGTESILDESNPQSSFTAGVEFYLETGLEDMDIAEECVLEEVVEPVGEESMEATEEDAAMDRLTKDEVVNCICQLNEENGLMIQCEVCLCWQHAICMELTEDTLPKKYVCYVCTNPPGIREKARFTHDQDWLKLGTMARFSMLPPDPSAAQTSQIMLATHDLVADLHGVNKVLDSTTRHIHVVAQKSHPELEFWTKDWDQEEERIQKERLQRHSVIESASSLPQTINIEKDLCLPVTIKKEPCEMNHVEPATELQTITEQEQTVFNGTDSDKIESVLSVKESENGYEQTLDTSEHKPPHIPLPVPVSDHISLPLASPCEIKLELLKKEEDGAEEEEEEVSCERRLLEHIMLMQDAVEDQLDLLEEQVTVLESADGSGNHTDDVLRDLPRVKKSVHQLISDLDKVKRLSLFH